MYMMQYRVKTTASRPESAQEAAMDSCANVATRLKCERGAPVDNPIQLRGPGLCNADSPPAFVVRDILTNMRITQLEKVDVEFVSTASP